MAAGFGGVVAQESAQSVLAYRAAIEVAGGDWLAGYAGGDGVGCIHAPRIDGA